MLRLEPFHAVVMFQGSNFEQLYCEVCEWRLKRPEAVITNVTQSQSTADNRTTVVTLCIFYDEPRFEDPATSGKPPLELSDQERLVQPT